MHKLFFYGLIIIFLIFMYYFFQRILYPSAPMLQTNQSDTSSPSPTQNNWQTYTNKNGYSIQYPSDWSVREYPGTGTGAGFQPKSLPEDPANEFITVNISPKVGQVMGSFESYCRVAASNEIQGYQSLVSIDPVITTSNLTGYMTTWKVSGPGMMMGGQPSTSAPITYFDMPSFKPNSTLQVILGKSDYQQIYRQMMKTVSIK